MTLRLTVISSAALILGSAAPKSLGSDAQQIQLINRVLAGTKCVETLYERDCDYAIGKLFFSIMDVGGNDTFIRFRHSDIEDDFYAMMYLGCIVVAPGNTDLPKYDLDYRVFVSPVTGNVYRTAGKCRSASRSVAK